MTQINQIQKRKFLIQVDLSNNQIIMLRLLEQKKKQRISGLTTTSALAAVENKIPDVSRLVKKTEYHTKIT